MLKSVLVRGRQTVIIITWLIICSCICICICSCIFGFWLLLDSKVFDFWLDFSDALFLYFGRVLGHRFMTQKHVLPLGCNFLNDFLR